MTSIGGLLLFFLGFTFPVVAAASGDGKITVDVVPAIEQNGKQAMLKFRVRYDGVQELVAKKSSMPGAGADPIAISADQYPIYEAKEFTACPAPVQVYFFNHSGPGEMTIKPGQEFVQEVDLNEVFKNMDEIVSKCDLVVHWSYRPVLKSGAYVERLAGAIVIPASMNVREVPSVTAPVTFR